MKKKEKEEKKSTHQYTNTNPLFSCDVLLHNILSFIRFHRRPFAKQEFEMRDRERERVGLRVIPSYAIFPVNWWKCGSQHSSIFGCKPLKVLSISTNESVNENTQGFIVQ